MISTRKTDQNKIDRLSLSKDTEARLVKVGIRDMVRVKAAKVNIKIHSIHVDKTHNTRGPTLSMEGKANEEDMDIKADIDGVVEAAMAEAATAVTSMEATIIKTTTIRISGSSSKKKRKKSRKRRFWLSKTRAKGWARLFMLQAKLK